MPKAVRRAESPAKAREPPTLAHHTSREDALGNVLSIDSEDIRGVPLTLLLGGFGRLFARSGAIAREQPELVYSYSRQVDTIDYFISHSWSAGRLQKFAALLMFFNASPAYFCSIVFGTTLVLFEIHYFDQLPGWLITEQVDNLNDMQKIRTSNLFLLLISPVLLVALLLWHRLSDTGGRSLFLDIACICQNNVVRKARGIASLGALLDRSETMLVLLDETYFTRLWCTFEIACFAKRAGAHRLKIIPVQQTLVEFAATMMWILVHFVIALLFFFSSSVRNREEMRSMIALIFMAILAPLQTIVLQAMLAGQRSAAALGKLKTFRLDQCECYSDRDALLRLIAKWYEDPASAHLPEETQRAIGWHRFENYVRHDLRLQLLACKLPERVERTRTPPRMPLLTALLTVSLGSTPQFDHSCRPGRSPLCGSHPPPWLVHVTIVHWDVRLSACWAREDAHPRMLRDAQPLRLYAADVPPRRVVRVSDLSAAPCGLAWAGRVCIRPRRRRSARPGHEHIREQPWDGGLDVVTRGVCFGGRRPERRATACGEAADRADRSDGGRFVHAELTLRRLYG